ncbi:hypothetical protein OHA70_15570 [Kribbella sp. NBC_00382]|uniref:hypothetical protein n=1 Tax=Kribbella sp. NBC_00382 TaxID=2975967 RepID=UPI002E23D068
MTGFWSTSANAVQAVAWLIPCCTEHNGDRGTDTGSVPPSDFWATSAQTMPVLALAIVVEARAIMQNWVPGEDRGIKRLQGFLWGASLLIYAFSEPACFRALAGREVWSGWPDVIEQGIYLGMTTLVVAPAIEFLVRSNARGFARLSPKNLRLGFQIALTRWMDIPRLRRLSERHAAMERENAAILRDLDVFESGAAAWEDTDERERFISEVRHQQVARLAIAARLEATRKELDAMSANTDANYVDFRERRKRVLAQVEADTEQWKAATTTLPPTDGRPNATPAASP